MYANDFGIGRCASNSQPCCYKCQHAPLSEWWVKPILDTGLDGTGDMYKVPNMEHFIKQVGTKSCDLVTGDGGFDYSHNFNRQELESTRLVLSQLYGAVRLLRRGGTFVCKMFDMHSESTVQILWIMALLFKKVSLTKPCSSRLANSEKYVVARGFEGENSRCHHMSRYMLHLLTSNEWSYNRIPRVQTSYVSGHFRGIIRLYNKWFLQCQCACIDRTLVYIRRAMRHDLQTHERRAIIRQQVRRAVKWCLKYAIDVNPTCLYFDRSARMELMERSYARVFSKHILETLRCIPTFIQHYKRYLLHPTLQATCNRSRFETFFYAMRQYAPKLHTYLCTRPPFRYHLYTSLYCKGYISHYYSRLTNNNLTHKQQQPGNTEPGNFVRAGE